MSMRNTATDWGSVSKTFHWLVVVLLVIQGILGLTMGDFARDTRMELTTLHKSIGVTILMVVILRLLWTLYSRRPAFAPGVTPLERNLAITVEVLLYVLMFAVPIAGWLMSDYGGRPVSWFGVFNLPQLVAENHDLHEVWEHRHEQLFWVLVLLATGHAGMAIYHQVVQRDDTLSRMMPKGWLRNPSGKKD